jgi:hypothetical protein
MSKLQASEKYEVIFKAEGLGSVLKLISKYEILLKGKC